MLSALNRVYDLTDPGSTLRPIVSSDPSSLYPLPHKTQCVYFGTSSLTISDNNILYKGGMSGSGRLSSRNENMIAEWLLTAGESEGCKTRRKGLLVGRVAIR